MSTAFCMYKLYIKQCISKHLAILFIFKYICNPPFANLNSFHIQSSHIKYFSDWSNKNPLVCIKTTLQVGNFLQKQNKSEWLMFIRYNVHNYWQILFKLNQYQERTSLPIKQDHKIKHLTNMAGQFLQNGGHGCICM